MQGRLERKTLLHRIGNPLLIIALSIAAPSGAYSFGAGVWGGYGIAAGGKVDDCSADSSCTKSGPAAGLSLYYAGIGPLKFGLGAGYQQLYKKASYKSTVGTTSIQVDSTKLEVIHLPVIELRIKIPLGGLFINGSYGLSVGIESALATSYSFGAGYELIRLGKKGSLNIGAQYFGHIYKKDFGGTVTNIVPYLGVSVMTK